MGNNTQLEFIVKAVDEASSQLEHVRESVTKLQTSVESTSSSMQKASGELSKVSAGNESMATSVFKGVAAWDLLKEGIHMATDFIKESVQKSIEASKQNDLTKATIESMGLSFAKVSPQLEAFGDKMLRLGVDNEAVTLSAAKLAKLAGGDLTKGMELAKMASDLTSSGFGDLESNTDTLAGVLSGHGTMAIRQFKLHLDETATTGEILNAIQKKITQTTEEYADTVPGKIKIVTENFGELQETIGNAFVDAMGAAMSEAGSMDDVLNVMKTTGKGVSVVIFEVIQVFALLGKAFKTTYEEGKLIVTTFHAVKDAMSGDFTKAHDELQAGFDDVNKSINSLDKTFNDIMHPLKAMEEQHVKNTEALKTHGATAKAVGEGIQNAQKGATKDLMSHKDAVAALTDAYKDMVNKTSTDLATMSDDHTKTMGEIQKSIAATQKAISDLNAAYTRQQTDDAAGMADKIVASQQKVSDLKKQIASTDDQIKKADLQKQLDTEQAGLDAVTDFTKANQTAITEAKRRAGLTQLQRDVEDYQKRKALQTAEYNDKLASLQQQLADEINKQNQEIELYKQRTTKIAEFTKAATDDYITASQSRVAQTKDEVNQEIQAFAALASAISAVRTASASAVTTYSVPNFGGKREMGGPVQMKTSYLVGERGPEIFVPSQDGTIVPNHALGGATGGGGNVYVNVTGNTITDQVGVKYLADKVGAEIMRVLRLNQKVSI